MPQDNPIEIVVNAPLSITDPIAFSHLGVDPAGSITYTGNNQFNYFPSDWNNLDTPVEQLSDIQHIVDPELREKLGLPDPEEEVQEEPPDAIWTNTPRELIREGPLPLYTSTTPDVAFTPRGTAAPPIPYDTFARPLQPLQFPPSVRATGQRVMHVPSQQQLTFGAEQGAALGVLSGTIMGPVETLQHSTTVRAEGEFVVRDGDAVWMNYRNNIGVADLTGSTIVNAPANSNVSPPEEEEDEGFFESLWNDAKDMAAAVAEAIGEFDRNHGRILTRAVGVVQAVGGAGEAVAGALLATGGAVATPTGVGTAPGLGAIALGGALWVNGWDNAWTGMQTAWSGEFQQTMMSQAAGDVAEMMGASPETVRSVENATDLASGGLSIGGGIAAGLRTTTREVVEAGARQIDEVAEETAEQTARVTRRLSARLRYLGRTPGKSSRTGREVRERMREEGTLRTNRRTGADEFLDEQGNWRPVDSPQTHMGHHPVDAVDWWNSTGRYFGAKSPEVRAWMLDSSNYRFEWGPYNLARGGATTSRYLPPVSGSP